MSDCKNCDLPATKNIVPHLTLLQKALPEVSGLAEGWKGNFCETHAQKVKSEAIQMGVLFTEEAILVEGGLSAQQKK